MKDAMIMTPGPTSVKENVRLARALKCTNPDLDLEFYDFYKETCERLGRIFKTKQQVRILSGEGILGLEAACASLTEVNDRVLVLDNGVFGEGFGDFVKMYGGEAVFFKGDRQRAINIDELKEFLEKDSNFKYATIVHCDTPSGVLNNLEEICPLLKSKGIITVVDTVAAVAGEDIKVDEWKIDIALGGSQKAFSAPPGLTMVTISEDAFAAMENRKTPIPAFYCNLLIWKDYYDKKWFPYSMPISDIMGLRVSIDNILEEGIEEGLKRHSIIAEATRGAVTESGLELFIEEGFSNTVTVIKVPSGINDEELREVMINDFNVFIAGSFDFLKGKVIRIGHMGENARIDKVAYTLLALDKSLEKLGLNTSKKLHDTFNKLVSSVNKS